MYDRDFIENLRAQQLDIPDRIDHIPEEESHDLIGGLEEEKPTRPEDDSTETEKKRSELKEEDGTAESEEKEQEKKEEDE